MKCVALGCPNKGSHRFPRDPSLKEKWLAALGREAYTPESRVCRMHFRDEDYRKEGYASGHVLEKRILNTGAVPSVFSLKRISSHAVVNGRVARKPKEKRGEVRCYQSKSTVPETQTVDLGALRSMTQTTEEEGSARTRGVVYGRAVRKPEEKSGEARSNQRNTITVPETQTTAEEGSARNRVVVYGRAVRKPEEKRGEPRCYQRKTTVPETQTIDLGALRSMTQTTAEEESASIRAVVYGQAARKPEEKSDEPRCYQRKTTVPETQTIDLGALRSMTQTTAAEESARTRAVVYGQAARTPEEKSGEPRCYQRKTTVPETQTTAEEESASDQAVVNGRAARKPEEKRGEARSKQHNTITVPETQTTAEEESASDHAVVDGQAARTPEEKSGGARSNQRNTTVPETQTTAEEGSARNRVVVYGRAVRKPEEKRGEPRCYQRKTTVPETQTTAEEESESIRAVVYGQAARTPEEKSGEARSNQRNTTVPETQTPAEEESASNRTVVDGQAARTPEEKSGEARSYQRKTTVPETQTTADEGSARTRAVVYGHAARKPEEKSGEARCYQRKTTVPETQTTAEEESESIRAVVYGQAARTPEEKSGEARSNQRNTTVPETQTPAEEESASNRTVVDGQAARTPEEKSGEARSNQRNTTVPETQITAEEESASDCAVVYGWAARKPEEKRDEARTYQRKTTVPETQTPAEEESASDHAGVYGPAARKPEEKSSEARSKQHNTITVPETQTTAEEKSASGCCIYLFLADSCVDVCEVDVTYDPNAQSESHDNICNVLSLPMKIQSESSVEVTSVGTQTVFKASVSFDKLKDTPSCVSYYTGFEAFDKLQLALRSLGPAAYDLTYRYDSIVQVSVEDQFLLTLIKLRRAIPDFGLAMIFDVSEKIVQNIVITWLNFMYHEWTNSAFQKATFSKYKKRTRSKDLGGTTPSGLITCSDHSYSGSASMIVERSDLREKCDPSADSVMSDRDLNVQDSIAPSHMTFNMPAFTKGMRRLPGLPVRKGRKRSRKRVRIEIITELTNTYKILKCKLRPPYAELGSEIFFVCCTLCNFREGVA